MTPTEFSLLDRFKEPSSWASLATGLTGLGIVIPSNVVQVISFIGAGVCVLLGIVLKEKSQ